MTWIVVPNWERFQHYGLSRRPPWIKNYTALLHKDEYLDLSLAARGLLHGIWLAYADQDGRLSVDNLGRGLEYRRSRHSRDHLASLNHAGLIELVASKPLHLHLKEKEKVSDAEEVTLTAPVGKDLHQELLTKALDVAADWTNGSNAQWNEVLDALERAYDAHLSEVDRMRLWDTAFTRQSNGPWPF